MEKECLYCHKAYVTIKKTQKFCSVECQHRSYRVQKVNRVKCVCLKCGKEFLKIPSKANEKYGKYCSRKCKDEHQKEIYQGEKNPSWKRKVSISEKEWRTALIKELWKSDDFRESVKNGIEKFVKKNGFWPGTDEKSKLKREKTMLERYGIHHNWCGKYGNRKCDKTTIEIYGMDPISIMMSLPNIISNTKPEKIFKEVLNELNIEFIPQYYLFYDGQKYKIYDFYIKKKNLLVEIDGDYWHANPMFFNELNKYQKSVRENDRAKNEIAKNFGYNIMRFWENDLKKNKPEIKEKIKSYYEN